MTKIESKAATAYAAYYYATRARKFVEVFAVYADGTSKCVTAVDVDGKRAARSFAHEYGATPYNF